MNWFARTRCLVIGLISLTAVGTFSAHSHAGDNAWTNTAGTLTWNTSDANWTSPAVWNNNFWNADGATFSTAGVFPITVSSTINVRSLNFFQNNGYSLTGGTINLTPFGSSSLAAGMINIGSTTNTTTTLGAFSVDINSDIVSSFGFRKTGDSILVLGGTANSFTGFVSLGNSSLGTNMFIGSINSDEHGGLVRLVTSSALAATTTVGIGNGILDIQANNVTIAGLTFSSRKPLISGAFVVDHQGVMGTGTLTVTGPIRVQGAGDGAANYINTLLSSGAGVLRLEVGGSGVQNRDLIIQKAISGTGLFKTFGVSATGDISSGSFTSLGNNTYTGATIINGGGSNIIGGTNTSTSLTVANGTTTLQGNGQFASATAMTVVSNGTLNLNNSASLTSGDNPPLAAANINNRISSSAAVLLDGGTLALTSSSTADILQSVASLNVTSGLNRINLFPAASVSLPNAVLTVTGNFTMSPGATMVVSGATLGSTLTTIPTQSVFTINGTAPTIVNGLIPGLYATNTLGGSPTTFATNSATPGVGIVGLLASDYTTLATVTSTTNADVAFASTVTTNTAANAIRSSANISINSGVTLSVGAGGFLNTGVNQTISGGTIDFGSNIGLLFNNASTTYSSAITGTAGLVRSGSGNITLSGDLSGLSGGLTNASTGTLNLNTSTYTGPITILAGTVATNADIGTGGLVTLGTPNTPAGAIGALTLLNLDTPNVVTFARNIAVVGGDGTSPFGQAAQGAVIRPNSQGTQLFTGTISLGTNLTIDHNDIFSAPVFSGVISGAGGIEANGEVGTVTLTNAANSFTGGVRINSGTLIATSSGSIGTGPIRFNGGTLQPNYGSSINGSGGVVMLGNGTINTGANNQTLAGAITGENTNAVLTKAGSGTLTITATGSFPGTLAVGPSSGSLVFSGAGALPGLSTLSIASGSSVTLDNSSTYLANRINDLATISLSGGLFNYQGAASAVIDPSERVGALVNSAAGSIVNIIQGTASPTVLRFASLTTSSTLTLRGDDLGGTAGNYTRIMFEAFTTNQAALPNVFFANTSGNSTSLTPAAYDTIRGVIELVPFAISGNYIDNIATSATPAASNALPVPLNAQFTVNAGYNGGPARAITGAFIYSLTLDGADLALFGGYSPTLANGNTPDGTLLIVGGLLTSQNGARTISSAAARTVSFGPSLGNITTNSDLTLDANVTLLGTGGLTKSGAGSLNLNGTYAVTGPLAVNAGTIAFGTNATVGDLSGAGTVQPNALTINQLGNSTFTGSYVGGTTLTKAGPGTLTFAPNNTPTYAGGTTIADGTLKIGSAGAAAVVSSNFSLGNASNNSGILDFNGFSPAANLTDIVIGGTGTGHQIINSNTATGSTIGLNFAADATRAVSFGGNVTVNKIDNTTLTLTGDSASRITGTTTGVFNINAGTLQLNSGGQGLGAGMSVNVASGATFRMNGSGTNNAANPLGTVTINNGSWLNNGSSFFDPTLNSLVFTNGGTVSSTAPGIGSLYHFQGTGAGITTSASANTAFLTSTNSADQIQNDTGTSLPITVAQGTTANGVDLNVNFKFNGGTTASIAKAGPGTMQLTGNASNSTYAYVVNQGRLLADGIGTGSGTVTVNSTGTLAGTGLVTGPVTVNTGGFIAGGNTTSPLGTLTATQGVSLTNNGGIQAVASASGGGTASLINITGESNLLNLNPVAGDKFNIVLFNDPANPFTGNTTYTLTLASVAATGNIHLNGTSLLANSHIDNSQFNLTALNFSITSYSLDIGGTGNTLVLQFTPVPEPMTMLGLGVMGLAAAGAIRRRMKKNA